MKSTVYRIQQSRKLGVNVYEPAESRIRSTQDEAEPSIRSTGVQQSPELVVHRIKQNPVQY
jgi:hypothetical protein